jgi:L-fucose isomerase-like protein
MEIKVKPIFVMDNGQIAGKTVDTETMAARATELSKELRSSLKHGSTLLEDTIISNENDLMDLRRKSADADVLLFYLDGIIPLNSLLTCGLPVIVFSGLYKPVLALYAFGVERHSVASLTLALDYQEIDERIEILNARKKLQNARIALLGFPPFIFSHWHHLPDLELASNKLGVQFIPIEIRELVEQIKAFKSDGVGNIAERWRQEAKEIIEPTKADIAESVSLYLALRNTFKQRAVNAMAINCLELGSLEATKPCYAMSRLQDEGIPTACEMDVVALLTMMILGYTADQPAFMGNIVSANPEDNIIKLSHCVIPTRMAGFSQSPKPYTLRNYHGRHGVTAHVQLDIGQEVTIARLSRELDKILVFPGEMVSCQDTTNCRTTVAVKISDARKFVQRAFGNHHALIYGNHVNQIKDLCRLLGISSVEF